MKNSIVLISFFFIFFLGSRAQSCDTVNLKKINTRAKKEIKRDVELAYQLAFEGYTLSKKCINTKYYFEALLTLARVYNQKDQPDSMVKLLTAALKKVPADADKYYIGGLNHQLGTAYVMKLKLDEGLKYAIAALKNYESIKDSGNISNALVNIGNVYQQQNNFPFANKYLMQAKAIALNLDNKTALGNVYNTLGILYAENNYVDSAEACFLQSTAIREKLHDSTSIVWNYNNLGGIYLMMQKPQKAIFYLQKALREFERMGNYDGQSSVANNLGELYMQEKDYKKALEYYSYSRKIYALTNNPENLENLYNNLSNYYDEMKDLKTAFRYSDSLIVLKDSLYGIRMDKSMAEMQTKYETEKKDIELAANKTELKLKHEESARKTIVIFAIIGVVILLTLLGFLLFRKKQLEQQAKLDAKIAEQKEIRIKSVIEAEEKERRRIAQDLHDGVGQILSAAKLNLSGLESQIVLNTIQQKDSFRNALSLIDDSVKEVRAVSHNMMPNTLIKLGLASAIREFITKIGNIPNLKIDLEIVGLDKRIDENIETVLYRVVQEVVSNIIKHAKATRIGMQLVKHENELSVIIEDNGVGFDTSNINAFDGIGLKNIISRIEFVNGNVHFDSTPGRGTTVVIEVASV